LSDRARGDECAEEVEVERIAASGFPIGKLNNGYLVTFTENIQDVTSEISTTHDDGDRSLPHGPVVR
jgi:hypothetical protein